MRKLFTSISLVIGTGLLLGWLIIKIIEPKQESSTKERSELIGSCTFQDSLLNYIFELRLEHPYIVYAQALEESGHFKSAICLENNNMFGMKMPERRPTTAIGVNKGHAKYLSWRDCVVDYALFQSAYMRGLSEGDYLSKLSESYAESLQYEKRIKLLKESAKRKR